MKSLEISPEQTVKYNGELYTVYACNNTYALLELRDRTFIKKQVRVKDLILL